MSKIIGTGMKRVDAPNKACGKAKYAGDYTAENMLHACLVRSEYSHAKIISIDENGRILPGSLSFVPPVMGLMLAGEVVKDLIKEEKHGA